MITIINFPVQFRCWFVMGMTMCAAAQPAPASESDPSWNVSIQAAKSVFLVAEPVVLRVAISNSASSPAKIYTELQNGVGAIYEVSRDNVVFFRVHPGFYRDPVGRTQMLATGEVFVHEEILLFNWRMSDPLFQVGTNYVRVSCYGKVSNNVQFVVILPLSQTDKEASQIMMRPEVMKAYALKNLSGVTNLFEQLANGQSVYSPYAALSLALNADKADALDWLAKADVNGFVLQSRAICEKARVYLEQGSKEAAHEQFQRLVSKFPNSVEAMEVNRKNSLEQSRP